MPKQNTDSPSQHLRSLIWGNRQSHSREYCSLFSTGKGYLFRGTVITLEEAPQLIEYIIECDRRWMTRLFSVSQERGGKTNQLTLEVDENQNWLSNQSPLPWARGLLDVDLDFSPATNTLHIRRLNLNVGEAAAVDAVWVHSGGLTLEQIRQTYTKIDDRHYGYVHPSSNLHAVLEEDDLGLIVYYGDLWKRVS